MPSMQFYPDVDLYRQYFKNLPPSNWFSNRIPDQMARNAIDSVNRSMNICERNETFLDFGAGNGRYSAALLSVFKKGYATEIEKEPLLVKLAKKYPNFYPLFGEKAALKIKDKIDFIILMDVIEHIPLNKIKTLVKWLVKLQDKGGVIHISTPNPIRCGTVSRSGIFYKRFKHGHHKHYLPNEISALFEPYGYRVVIEGYEEFALMMKVRYWNLGFAVIDQRLLPIPGYKLISLPFIAIINAFFYALATLMTQREFQNRHDNFHGLSMVLTLKKY